MVAYHNRILAAGVVQHSLPVAEEEAFHRDSVAEEAYYTDMVLLVAYHTDWEECHKMVCRTRLMEEALHHRAMRLQWDQWGASHSKVSHYKV